MRQHPGTARRVDRQIRPRRSRGGPSLAALDPPGGMVKSVKQSVGTGRFLADDQLMSATCGGKSSRHGKKSIVSSMNSTNEAQIRTTMNENGH